MIIVQTPLRISFFGGGTDFPGYFLNEGGCVLSTAINKYIFVVIKERYDDMLRIGYTRTEIVENIDMINHELIREALRKTGVKKGVEIITMGDIAAGTGLGSSSAVTVGALHAMYLYRNTPVPIERLAEEACDIEVNIVGKPIGFQDQYIAAYGGFNYMRFNMDESVFVDPIICKRETKEKLNQKLNESLNLTPEQLQQKATEELKKQVNQKVQQPGFEYVFALAGILGTALILRRKR